MRGRLPASRLPGCRAVLVALIGALPILPATGAGVSERHRGGDQGCHQQVRVQAYGFTATPALAVLKPTHEDDAEGVLPLERFRVARWVRTAARMSTAQSRAGAMSNRDIID